MVRVHFEVKTDLKTKIKKWGLEVIGKRLRVNFDKFKPIIENAINNVVVANANDFTPNTNDAAELGVVDYDASIGWAGLLTSSNNGVTTFEVIGVGGKNSTLIGRIKVNINTGAFYVAPTSIQFTPDSDKIDKIPWMEWFLEGKTIDKYSFSDETPIPVASRTGGGVMIKGGLWNFTPRNPYAIGNLLNEIRLELMRDLEKDGAKIV